MSLKRLRTKGSDHPVQKGVQLGASLIEVLVSIVIASIGLLALAGVNASSVRYAKLTQYRATSSQLAADLGERMRANKTGLTGGSYSYQLDFDTQNGAAPAAPGNLCNSLTPPLCTAAQIAAVDLWRWRTVVRDNLPQGAVFLLPDPGVPTAADVWVSWLDPSVDNNDDRPASVVPECPNALGRAGNLAIRCMYFRINL